jgi:hypothetical protein
MKRLNLLLMIILAFTMVRCQTMNLNYFPRDALGESQGKWYTKALSALKEPSLLEISQVDKSQCYRFLWLRSFHEPMSFRIKILPNANGVLIVKMTNVKDDGEPGKLIKNITIQLAKDQVEKFLNRIEKVNFWRDPSESSIETTADEQTYTLDGAEWIYEGIKDGVYNINCWTSPDDGAYRDVGLYFIQLSGLKIEEIY